MLCAKIINLSDINDKYHVFFIVYIRQFPDNRYSTHTVLMSRPIWLALR